MDTMSYWKYETRALFTLEKLLRISADMSDQPCRWQSRMNGGGGDISPCCTNTNLCRITVSDWCEHVLDWCIYLVNFDWCIYLVNTEQNVDRWCFFWANKLCHLYYCNSLEGQYILQYILRMYQDGLSDSVRQSIVSHEPHDHVLLCVLLKAFEWFRVCIFYHFTIVPL